MSQNDHPVSPTNDPTLDQNPNQDPESISNPNPNPPATQSDQSPATVDYPDRSNNPSADTKADPNAVSNHKRNREEEYATTYPGTGSSAGAPAQKRRVKSLNDVIYRIVVPSKQIGRVIGRSGSRIHKVREDSQATVKIADAIARHEERVIIISSKDSDSVFSDAEKALHQIVSLVLMDDGAITDAVQAGAGHIAANTIRLLIAGNQTGALIGVSGQNIVKLRNSSGAVITVLSPSELPPYASAHESDRIVQISGEIPAVLRAVVEIGCQLRDNSPKQVIQSKPSNNPSFQKKSQRHFDRGSGEIINMELLVPENLVGGLIGRFGANIARIRHESGAHIKVFGSRGEQTQRQINVTGSTNQVALAKQRVDEYVYHELMRQGGGPPQQPPGPPQHVPSQQPIPDMSNTQYQGYVDPHAQGYADPYAQGYTDPHAQGYGDPHAQGYGDPHAQSYGDPHAQSYGDPHAQGYGDQQTHYGSSKHEGGGLMAAYPPPPAYGSDATNQAPYYGHQNYPAPPL